MVRFFIKTFVLLLPMAAALSCDYLVTSDDVPPSSPANGAVELEKVAAILSALPIEREQMGEVYDAVNSSSSNGYDEEYMLKDLLCTPGAGVGDDAEQSRAASPYRRPMKELFEEYFRERCGARSGEDAEASVREMMAELENSDIQIYWPYSEQWDRMQMPIITFDPKTDALTNEGYLIDEGADGRRIVSQITVDENTARKRPVWVVNTNSDSGYKSLEMRRREDPHWGEGGGVIVRSKDGSSDIKTLYIKDLKMNRQYDSWFAGGSEFFVKCGAASGFRASTEAELRLFTPTVTDLMVVVKRRQLGEAVPFNAVLVSDWTDQLVDFAFMVTEDDGGTRIDWKFDTTVKYQSKTYSINVQLPLNSRDDIVWRGSLSSRYFEKYDGSPEPFGNVDITFELR